MLTALGEDLLTPPYRPTEGLPLPHRGVVGVKGSDSEDILRRRGGESRAERVANRTHAPWQASLGIAGLQFLESGF